jgi:hypothetical protein
MCMLIVYNIRTSGLGSHSHRQIEALQQPWFGLLQDARMWADHVCKQVHIYEFLFLPLRGSHFHAQKNEGVFSILKSTATLALQSVVCLR